MSDEAATWLLDVSAGKAHSRQSESVTVLQSAANDLLRTLFTDAQWDAVQVELALMARDNSIDGILARQRDAMAMITNSLWTRHDQQRSTQKIEGSLAAELRRAELDLRAHLPQIAEQLPQVEQAAEKISKDPARQQATERIAKAVRETDVSKLSTLGLAIVLWWLLAATSMKDIAALTFWYVVLKDALDKKND